MRVVFLVAVMLAVAGCATPVPVLKPCGVLKDSLQDVTATTPAGNQRISVHYERGRAAGCWK